MDINLKNIALSCLDDFKELLNNKILFMFVEHYLRECNKKYYNEYYWITDKNYDKITQLLKDKSELNALNWWDTV